MEKTKKKIIVVGAKGKMGSLVCQKLEESCDFEVERVDLGDELDQKNGDMIIDFASAASSLVSAKFAAKKKIPLIVGSTGQTKSEEDFILSQGKIIPVLKCANFSVGISMVKSLLKEMLKIHVNDVTIFEKHHSEKKDSPSGTALELQKTLQESFSGNIQILSERGGKEIGTHKVDFYFGSELVSVEHKAFSRDAFADGAIVAVRFMIGASAGVYDFDKIVKNV